MNNDPIVILKLYLQKYFAFVKTREKRGFLYTNAFLKLQISISNPRNNFHSHYCKCYKFLLIKKYLRKLCLFLSAWMGLQLNLSHIFFTKKKNWKGFWIKSGREIRKKGEKRNVFLKVFNCEKHRGVFRKEKWNCFLFFLFFLFLRILIVCISIQPENLS